MVGGTVVEGATVVVGSVGSGASTNSGTDVVPSVSAEEVVVVSRVVVVTSVLVVLGGIVEGGMVVLVVTTGQRSGALIDGCGSHRGEEGLDVLDHEGVDGLVPSEHGQDRVGRLHPGRLRAGYVIDGYRSLRREGLGGWFPDVYDDRPEVLADQQARPAESRGQYQDHHPAHDPDATAHRLCLLVAAAS